MSTSPDGLKPGDVCITGSSRHPRFRVIAVSEDRAWIRDVEVGKDSVVPVEHCHRVADDADRPDAPPAPDRPTPEREGAPMPSTGVFPDGTPRP